MNQNRITPDVSVIIPSCDRPVELRRALGALALQSMPSDQFEVIIVDNAASVCDQDRLRSEFPLDIIYIQQADLGATRSRNMGAKRSRGEVLVFQDDDIVLQPRSLELLTDTIAENETAIVLGNLVLPEQIRNNSVFSQINAKNPRKTQLHDIATIHYTKCMTGLLAIKRKLFFEIGMFQDPTGGWPNWDDVDFGYRARLSGYSIRKHLNVIGEHWDHSATDLYCTCDRWFRASKSAVLLFRKYPDLQSQIPMYSDKTPIDWDQDSPSLVIRKIARTVISTPSITYLMEALASSFERWYPSPRLLRPLYRWITGSYMYRGFRQGLRAYGYFSSEFNEPPQ